MGRPTKLTPEVQARVCEAVAGCNTFEAACAYAGIDRKTFYDWKAKGEKHETGIYRDFLHAVREAEAQAEMALVAQWRAAVPRGPVAGCGPPGLESSTGSAC